MAAIFGSKKNYFVKGYIHKIFQPSLLSNGLSGE
jgi:hypothetical protein